MQQLAELEKEYPEFYDPNSPTMRVGSDINKNFVQVQHRYPMLSLQNTYTEEEIADFFNRVKRSLNEDFEIRRDIDFTRLRKWQVITGYYPGRRQARR